jgi:hypothetical protein
MGYWRENLRRSIRDWEGREVFVGIIVILVTALGYGVFTANPEVTRIAAIAAVGYIALLVLPPYLQHFGLKDKAT